MIPLLLLLALAAAQDLCDPPGTPSLLTLRDRLGPVMRWNGTSEFEVALCQPHLPYLCGAANATACRDGGTVIGAPPGWTWRPKSEVWSGPEDAYGLLFQAPSPACFPASWTTEVVFINATPRAFVIDRDDGCSTKLLVVDPDAFLGPPPTSTTGAPASASGSVPPIGTTGMPPIGDGGDGGSDDGTVLGEALGGGVGGAVLFVAILVVAGLYMYIPLALLALAFNAGAVIIVVACCTPPAITLVVVSVRAILFGEDVVILGNEARELCEADMIEVVIGPEIGRGSFGNVHKATFYGSIAAVKRIPFREKEDTEQVLREVRLMGKVGLHRNVAKIYGYYLGQSELLVFLEWYEGRSLNDHLNTASTQQRWIWAAEILRGLHFIHRRGVLHRDLACRNVLISKDGEAHICDFGLGRFVPTGGKEHRTVEREGPIRWMAPEAFDGVVSTKTDIHMYGVLLWELLTGLVPWERLTAQQVREQAGTVFLPETGIPELDELVRTLTAFDPDDRPDTGEALPLVEKVARCFCQVDSRPASGVTPDDMTWSSTTEHGASYRKGVSASQLTDSSDLSDATMHLTSPRTAESEMK